MGLGGHGIGGLWDLGDHQNWGATRIGMLTHQDQGNHRIWVLTSFEELTSICQDKLRMDSKQTNNLGSLGTAQNWGAPLGPGPLESLQRACPIQQ